MTMLLRPFSPSDEGAVIALWRRCDLLRPWNDPHQDIQRKLKVAPELFLVGVLNEEIIATVMAGYEGHRGWINYLAVTPEQRFQGCGRLLVIEVERLLKQRGCPKVNLQVRAGNSGAIAFYSRLGYSVDTVVSMGKRLEFDDLGLNSS
jgi:ribosomal protein S18 acetylase RimI-like enzyme